MKKRFFIAVSILFLLLLTSCDLLGGSLMGFLDEYTNNAAIMKHEIIGGSYPTDDYGVTCIDTDGAVKLLIRNPKEYNLTFSYAFNDPNIQAHYDDMYGGDPATAIQWTPTDARNGSFNMTFPQGFLNDIINNYTLSGACMKDISGNVYMFEAETERPFGNYYISLHADTAPSTIATVLVQQTDADLSGDAPDNQYVLCFNFPKTEQNNDLQSIRINNDIFYITYSSGGISFIEPTGTTKGSLSTDKPSLNPVLMDGPEYSPADNSINLYYYTGDYRTTNPADITYNITITDNAGLTATASVRTFTEKLTPVSFYIVGFNNNDDINDNDGSYSPIGNDTDGRATLKIVQDRTTTTDGTASGTPQIVCTLYSTDNPGGVTYKGTSPLTIPLEVYGSYQASAYATCTNTITSDSAQSATINVLHSRNLYVSNSGSFSTGNGTKNKPYRTIQQCINAIQSSNVDPGSDGNGYFINVLSDITPDTSDTFSSQLNNSLVFVRISDNPLLLTYPVTIQGVDTNGKAVNRTINAQSNGRGFYWDGGTLNLKNLTITGCTSTSTGGGFYLDGRSSGGFTGVFTNCIIKGNSAQLSGGGIFLSTDSTGTNLATLTLNGCTLTGNTSFLNGGGIYSETASGGRNPDSAIILKGTTKITSNTAVKGGGVYARCKLELQTGAITISGNTTTDGSNSNLYLEKTNNSTNSTLTVTGNLSGSKIGISTELIPTPDNPLMFATYESACKPATGVFTGDRNYKVELGDEAAQFTNSSISGGGSISTAFYDDLDAEMSYSMNQDGGMTGTLSLMCDGTSISISDITVLSKGMSYHGEDITYGWTYESGKLTLQDYLVIQCKATDAIPAFNIVFTYNGQIYNLEFLVPPID